MVAKKYNKGRVQKRNIDRNKLNKYREEISRELGISLPPVGSKEREKVREKVREKDAGLFPDTDRYYSP